ncbi:MAG TPA: HAMP domain-containing sensor histidine kinase [Thermomonas sp.]|jgi:signal transduction histidine kinase|uniref:sensor histidine kinase n=1 Tax=Thermomonas sp. TaxID=1971895 RepID=UPI002CA09F85|nr:HAMP domain-containing sensor histidine kinase [Thermomonas sp.]HOV96132.1 HAMP domain-containing sensor histidine kinase [Thermomonas sp.]
MSTPLTLRHRFALLALLLGLVLSGLSTLSLLSMTEDYESIVSAEILRGQAEDYGQRLAQTQAVPLPATHRLRGYRSNDPNLPAAYSHLPPGMHEDAADNDTHVGVFDTAAGRLIFAIDMGDFEQMERHLHRLVIMMMVLGTALAGWLGWLLAGIALQPLRRLAEGVEALPVQPQPSQLAAGVSHDALGQLATAIDAYQSRLVAADAREQAFLADASHELRTPLAVIQGVTEVLLDDASATPAQRTRLARLERGVQDMGQLLEAMLAIARRKPLAVEAVAIHSLLQEVATRVLVGKPTLQLTLHAEGQLHTARREAVLLIAGMLRLLLNAQSCTGAQLRMDANRLDIVLITPTDATATQPPPRADTGTGSALLDRLAARLHWQVRIHSPAQASLLLHPNASA